MTLEQAAAVAEIIGAVAVVISLVYVGVQIRQNTISQNALMHQQLVDSQNEVNRNISNNPDVNALIENATKDIHSLSNEELRQLRFAYFGFFNIWHIAYQNYHRGMLEKPVLEEWERGIAWMLSTDSAARAVWDDLSPVYEPTFREHINSLLDNELLT
ncbi:MAG: hypothetical protein ACU84Q_01480 [Gammaproteobacteria bacterium]